MRASEFLTEGIHDPAIFKAVFVLGGPGSGKSYISRELGLNSLGLVSINSDIAFTYMMQKHQLDQKMPPEETEKRDIVRSRAKIVTNKKMDLAIQGRLGIHIDTTGSNYSKIANLKSNFEQLGYECFLIVINTSLETALKRNSARDRTVPEDAVINSWKNVQSNIGNFSQIFDKFAIIDNNEGSGNTGAQINKIYAKLASFITSPPKNNIARRWLEKNKHKQMDEAKYEGNIGIMELIKFFQQHPELKSEYDSIKAEEGAVAAMKFALAAIKAELQGEPYSLVEYRRRKKRSKKKAAYSGYGYPAYVGSTDSGGEGGGE